MKLSVHVFALAKDINVNAYIMSHVVTQKNVYILVYSTSVAKYFH